MDGQRLSRQTVVGSLAWEQAGGPPLTLTQRAALLGGTAAVLATDVGPRLRFFLARHGLLSPRWPAKVDLDAWKPPDSSVAREAETLLRDVASPQTVHHSFRCWYFSGILHEHGGLPPTIDREALYVAILLHDVGLFEVPRAPSEHCFTVGGAREARRIASAAGWDEARQDKVATAITSNLNPFVPAATFGAEAHLFRAGGLIDVLAQEWQVHPENLRAILRQHPRDGFAEDTAFQVRREAQLNPGCRFACFGFLFPLLVGLTEFSAQARGK